MMTLNKAHAEEFPLVYFTKDYRLEATNEGLGYHVVNGEYGVIEVYADQLPSAVFALLSMQEAYDEIMGEDKDIVREYNAKKAQQNLARSNLRGPSKLN